MTAQDSRTRAPNARTANRHRNLRTSRPFRPSPVRRSPPVPAPHRSFTTSPMTIGAGRSTAEDRIRARGRRACRSRCPTPSSTLRAERQTGSSEAIRDRSAAVGQSPASRRQPHEDDDRRAAWSERLEDRRDRRLRRGPTPPRTPRPLLDASPGCVQSSAAAIAAAGSRGRLRRARPRSRARAPPPRPARTRTGRRPSTARPAARAGRRESSAG